MKSKFTTMTILLTLALLAAACGTQDTTSEPGPSTALPTLTVESPAAEEATQDDMTPTAAAEAETPVQATDAAGTTPTDPAGSATPAAEAGGTAGIPQTGPGDAGLPDDLDEVLRVLRATGVTVNLADPVESDVLSVPGQIVHIDNEEVEFYTYETAEQVEAQASLVADLEDPEGEPQFYKLGTMLVRYVGNSTLVRDLLEDVLGAQAAGQ
jgi:hypothetical protein